MNEPTDPIQALQAAVDKPESDPIVETGLADDPARDVTPKDSTATSVTETGLNKPGENLFPSPDEIATATGLTVVEREDPHGPVDPSVQADLDLVQYLTDTYIYDPLEEKPYTKAVLYGNMDSGKTKSASDAPKPLLIAIERGASTLLNHPDILRNGVKVMKFANVDQIEDFVALLKKGYFENYETIILDTFSELQYTALDGRVVQKWQQSPLTRDPYTPEGKDYQGNTGHMRRIAAAFRDIDRNVVFTCHAKDREVGPAKINLRGPSTSPQVTEALNQYVDVVAYQYSQVDAESGQHKFYALTHSTSLLEANIVAKSRIGSLPTFVEDLTFNMIHNAKLEQIKQIKKELGR